MGYLGSVSMQTIAYLFAVLSVLWLVDLHQTINITRKYGISAEENPVARFLLKHGQRDFAAFKILDLIVLLCVLALLFERQETYATYLAAAFAGFYLITVLHNYCAYRKHTNKSVKYR